MLAYFTRNTDLVSTQTKSHVSVTQMGKTTIRNADISSLLVHWVTYKLQLQPNWTQFRNRILHSAENAKEQKCYLLVIRALPC